MLPLWKLYTLRSLLRLFFAANTIFFNLTCMVLWSSLSTLYLLRNQWIFLWTQTWVCCTTAWKLYVTSIAWNKTDDLSTHRGEPEQQSGCSRAKWTQWVSERAGSRGNSGSYRDGRTDPVLDQMVSSEYNVTHTCMYIKDGCWHFRRHI